MFQRDTPLRRVALYIRVSTSEQQVDGYGIEAQQARLLDYVENNKALYLATEHDWIFRDTHTGSDLNRPGFEAMMEGVRKGKFDAILVWKIDRLSRSLKHLLTIFEELEAHQVSFISVQENIDFRGPIGKLIFQIFGAIAQFERELIKGRTTMGRLASAEMGNFTGTYIPYAYKPVPNESGRGKKLAIVPAEKKWVEQIYDWYIYENLGFGQIADKLNTLHVPKGKHVFASQNRKQEWTERTVWKILTSSIYRGEFVANNKDELGNPLPEDKWTIVSIPACISEVAFQQAQVARTQRKAGYSENTYILGGKLRDISISPSRGFVGVKRHKGGFSYRRKQFDRDDKHYSVFEIPAKALEEWVWNKIMEAMRQPELFIKAYFAKEEKKEQREKIQEQLIHLRAERCNIEMAISRVEHAYDNGTYSEAKLREKVTQKNTELTRVQEQEILLATKVTDGSFC